MLSTKNDSSDTYSAYHCDMLNNDHFMVQCNFNPTRMLNETDGNILDLILTKTPDLVSNVEVLTDHFNSDHFPVSFDIKFLSGRPHKPVLRKIYNFKKANFSELNELLKCVAWNCAFLKKDVDICTEKVNDLLLAAADICIPAFTVKKKINPPWITKDMIIMIKKKERLWRKLKARPSEALSQKFKELRRSVKQVIRSEYKRYLQHLASQLKVNAKRFWSYHSIKSKSKRLPEVITYNGRSATKPQEQANLFNIHFHSVFCTESIEVPAPIQTDLQDPSINPFSACHLSTTNFFLYNTYKI